MFIENNNQIKFHPGLYILDYIIAEDITVKEFANKTSIPLYDLVDLLEGFTDMSDEIAEKLLNYMGISKDLWLNLQKDYNKEKKQCQ